MPAQSSTQSSRKLDDKYWFEDGNILLIAQDVEFRVYRGLLTSASHVFRDILSIPQQSPYAADEDTPGVPLVHLSDHPNDVRTLFEYFIFGNALK